MTLFETAGQLQLQLDAASAADEEDVLLSRGRTVRDAIVAATEHYEAAQSYRVMIGLTDAPPLNTKAIRQAIGHFRGALSKSSSNAFQQRPAATLEEVLAAQTRRVDHWIKSTWERVLVALGRWLSAWTRVSCTGQSWLERRRRIVRQRSNTF